MNTNTDPVYTRHVVEFVAVANEYCRYAEHASELKGKELLNILQRLLPLLYLKATFLPVLNPVCEDGNEKFVMEPDWFVIHDAFKTRFGTANDYLEVFDEKINEEEGPFVSSLAENMADIYQDLKDLLMLYQTGTKEVMNDALWECRMSFENYWGQKLVNALRAIHMFICSGEEIGEISEENKENDKKRNQSDWFISRRQREFGE
jgi:hypothetical protein